MPSTFLKLKSLTLFLDKLPRNDNFIRDVKILPYPKSVLIESIFDYIRLDFRRDNEALFTQLILSLCKFQVNVGDVPIPNNKFVNPQLHQIVSQEELNLKENIKIITLARNKSHEEFEASYFVHTNRFD